MNNIDFDPKRGTVMITYDPGDETGREYAEHLCEEMKRTGILASLEPAKWNWGSTAGAFIGVMISFVLGWLCGRYQ